MPKGITQEQVNDAADTLVAAGEKPTVEKIRDALGTGSPNTVTRMLGMWRGTLAQRLQDAMTLPEVAPEVGQAFVEVWRLAVMHAKSLAQSALTEDQNALFAAQTSMTQERKLWEIAVTEAQSQVAASTMKLAQAELQCNERQTLADQLYAQVADLIQQRERLQHQLEQQRAELDALRTERNAMHEHIRAVEDRAHQQVDHTRQEISALQQRLDREQQGHAKAISQFTTQQDALKTALRAAERAAAHHAGQVAALETAVTRWQSTQEIAKKRNSASATKARPGGRSRKTSP